MTQIQTLATEMNVSASDLEGFIAALSVWMAKGYSMEQAIEKNLRQMTRLAENALEMDLKPSAIEWFYE